MTQGTNPIPSLRFGRGNAKVGKEVYTFSLPAGHSCPMAHKCLAKAHRKTGRLTDGPAQEFRCFSASAEAAFPTVRKRRWANLGAALNSLRKGGPDALAKDLGEALPEKAQTVRIHVAGDFFNAEYLEAWVKLAQARRETVFYGYTKSLSLWIEAFDQIRKAGGIWPENLRLTASLGGTEDHLAELHGLPTAQVVFHPQEAKALKLKTDHDDKLARAKNSLRKHFALLLHGPQQKGTPAAEATATLRAEDIDFGYRRAA